jgi:four helix bundle protein
MSFELEKRFENFAVQVRDFCTRLKWDIMNTEYIRQVIRSSASIGANYIEASDIGKADEKMKIKISRREAKESAYFLKLVLTYENENLETERSNLIDEAVQIRKILSSIIKKLEEK